MTRILSAAVIVLALAVAALGYQLNDARDRVQALEERSRSAAATPAGRAATRASSVDDSEQADAPAQSDSGGPTHVGGLRAPRNIDEAAPVAGAVAASRAAPAVAPDARVADIVKSELQRIDDEKSQRREERARARVAQRVADLTEKASLTSEQAASLQQMLEAESVELRQLFTDARDGDVPREELRDRATAVRKKTDDNAGALLDDKQKAAYADMRKDEVDRFFGRGPSAPRGD